MSARCYTDAEWARIMAAAWAAEDWATVHRLFTTKRSYYSGQLHEEYGRMLCPIKRPSRPLISWMLAMAEGILGKETLKGV